MRELFSTNQKVTGSNPVGRAREETLVNQGFFRFLGNERTPEKRPFLVKSAILSTICQKTP